MISSTQANEDPFPPSFLSVSKGMNAWSKFHYIRHAKNECDQLPPSLLPSSPSPLSPPGMMLVTTASPLEDRACAQLSFLRGEQHDAPQHSPGQVQADLGVPEQAGQPPRGDQPEPHALGGHGELRERSMITTCHTAALFALSVRNNKRQPKEGRREGRKERRKTLLYSREPLMMSIFVPFLAEEGSQSKVSAPSQGRMHVSSYIFPSF